MANRSPLSLEFKAAHDAFAAGGFALGWERMAKHFATLTDTGGPHDAEAVWLDDLRSNATTKYGHNGKLSETDGLLSATKGFDIAKPADDSKLNADARKRAAALKLLRHLYLVRKRGAQQIWILALANSFRDWPSEALATGNLAAVKSLMGDKKEPFSARDKKHLADAAQEGMKFVQRAVMVLAAASGTDAKATAAQELVKRWFTGAAASASDVSTAVATLQAGFKKIQAVLGSGRLLFSDHPEVRHATDADNGGFWDSEAFVKGAREAMDAVYIESAFFKKGNTLEGLKNWARIVVHELSHRELATEDHGYSWKTGGIAAGVGLTPAEAITNADSWAFFAVDCAAQLTKSELKAALT